MFCRNCGSNIPEGHTECIHCGTKVSKASLASLQSFNNTQVVQKKSSNTGYLVIIFFLLGVITMLSFEAFGNEKKLSMQEQYPEITPDMSPDVDDPEETNTYKANKTNKAVANKSKNSYHSNGYVFEIPDDFGFEVNGDDALVEYPELGLRFSMRAYPGTYVSLASSISYITERFETYGYTEISSDNGTINDVKYYVIYFVKNTYKYARIIAVVNDELLLQSDCVLDITSIANSEYYINLITSIIKDVKIETTHFSSETPTDFAEATEEFNNNIFNQ